MDFPRRWKFIFPIIWLVYLVFPFSDLIQRPAPQSGVGLAVICLFVAAYLFSWWDPVRSVYYVLAEMSIVAYFVLAFDSNYLYMVFFISPVIAQFPSKKQFRIFTGLLIVLLAAYFIYSYPYISRNGLLNLLPGMIVALLIPIGIRLGTQSRELRGQLHVAREEIARLSRQEERMRISRDLHDTLGHTLSLITLKSELVEKLIGKNPERAALEAKDIQSTARAALKQVRELVSEMAAVSIREELGHAERILAAAGIELQVRGVEEEEDIQPFVRNMLGMCLRESVTNVVKHSRASRCLIEFGQESDQLTLSVTDNGLGVVRDKNGAVSLGRGLLGMKERLDLVDGRLDISAQSDGGTCMKIAVPRIIRNQKEGAGT